MIPAPRFLLGAFLTVMFSLHGATLAAPWKASVDEREGLPIITRGGAGALSSTFVFWGRNWKWADQQVKFRTIGPFRYSASGRNEMLGFDLWAQIGKSSGQSLVWQFRLDAGTAQADVIGGGISFVFDPVIGGSEMGEPELLSANRGWMWEGRKGTRVEMRFDPPLASITLKKGETHEIRAFFFDGTIAAGRREYTATLSVSDDMAIAPTLAERFGLEDHTAWPSKIVDLDSSPVDLSFLNTADKPAGKRGFLRANGDKLVFSDGTHTRFWGTNLTSYALFQTPRDSVRKQARRLSRLGFNLVRIHHHDSAWVNPNIFGDQQATTTRNLDPAMMEKLDWWIKCLKDEGIYVWLDLHSGREFEAGDGIDGFDEISKGRRTASLKGYNYVNASILDAMKRFNEAYVNHLNRHTGLRYKDDPAIIAMLLTNENDLTHHYGNSMLPDKKVPRHAALYMTLSEAFAAKHRLDRNRTWRSWEHGPSKLFLNDLEQRFNTDMIAHLRALGVKVPIVTTSTWGGSPLSSLPALTLGDIVDAHSYGGINELARSPLVAPNLIHWIAASQISGKPLAVSEWNVEAFPAPDRHSIPLYMAASAAHQGWDALMQYAYSQVSLDSAGYPSNWHAFNDPAMISTLPAAALLFRRGDVREAGNIYAFAPQAGQLFNQLISPATSIALRTSAEMGRLVIALPPSRELAWLAGSSVPTGAVLIADPDKSLIPDNAMARSSDSKELWRNWDRGIFTVDSPRTQAATGWIGGETIALSDVEITARTRHATVAVQSLDGSPIRDSRDLLISLGARALPARPREMPFHSELVETHLAIRAPPGLSVYRTGRFREAGETVHARYSNGRYLIDLDRSLGTYWFQLR